MIFGFLVLAALLLILFLIRHSEKRVEWVMRFTRKTHERISALEVNDVSQDIRIHDQGKAIDTQSKLIKDLGKDVGWGDDKQQTEVIPIDVEIPPKK